MREEGLQQKAQFLLESFKQNKLRLPDALFYKHSLCLAGVKKPRPLDIRD